MSFLGGAFGGYADEAQKRKDSGQKGLLRGRKKKTSKSSSGPAMGVLGDFRHGGRVKKTGVYRLHKGETVKRSRGKKR